MGQKNCNITYAFSIDIDCAELRLRLDLQRRFNAWMHTPEGVAATLLHINHYAWNTMLDEQARLAS